jgi:hypothetical protein
VYCLRAEPVSRRVFDMGDSVPSAERLVGMSLTEIALAFDWSDERLADHLAELALVDPVDLTPGDLERVARPARQAKTGRPLAS